MEEDPISRNKLKTTINQTKDIFLGVSPETLQNNLYEAFTGISNLFLAYTQDKGKEGWSKNIVGNDSSPIYSPDEQIEVENSFSQISSFLDPVLLTEEQEEKKEEEEQTQQKGGSLKPGISKKDLLSYDAPFGTINPEDISIDKSYKKVVQYIDDLDEKNRILAKTLGPFRFINELKIDPKIPLPPPFLPISIPARAIVPAIMTFLELLRVMVSFGPFSNNFLRKTFSLVLAIGDIANGSWKNGILSAIGIVGTYPLLIGIFGKLANNTYELMSPELRVQLRDDIFKGSKSVFIGFWLYLFSILSPDIVRSTINTTLANLEKPLQELNEKIDELENKVRSELSGKGVKVTFPRLPLEMMPSLEDIQNIQVLATQPEIYCSPEFQNVIEPLMKLVPIRLIFELMNIPLLSQMTDNEKQKCQGISTITEALTDKLEPTIEIVNKENKTLENKPLENKPLENKTLENKPLENKTLENKTLENKTLENKPLQNKSIVGGKRKTRKIHKRK